MDEYTGWYIFGGVVFVLFIIFLIKAKLNTPGDKK